MFIKLTSIYIDKIMCSENLPYSSLQIKEMLSDPNYVNLGLIKNNKLVAYLITNISDQIDIIWIYVFPPARRNKYASAMIEHIHSKFNKNIMVEVNQINTPAINLYKKFGFQFVNNRKKYYENKYDALVMKLNRI